MKSLIHHFLIPSPTMDDMRFHDALIYICRHTADGAWGFVVNRALPGVSVGGLLTELELPISQPMMQIAAMDGGPVRPEAGFVLHTGQPTFKSSYGISENICLTTSKDILASLTDDNLSHYLLCMGYCSWGTGQLDREIADGDWLTCPADLTTLFATPLARRLPHALDKIGVKPARLADTIGHA